MGSDQLLTLGPSRQAHDLLHRDGGRMRLGEPLKVGRFKWPGQYFTLEMLSLTLPRGEVPIRGRHLEQLGREELQSLAPPFLGLIAATPLLCLRLR